MLGDLDMLFLRFLFIVILGFFLYRGFFVFIFLGLYILFCFGSSLF